MDQGLHRFSLYKNEIVFTRIACKVSSDFKHTFVAKSFADDEIMFTQIA